VPASQSVAGQQWDTRLRYRDAAMSNGAAGSRAAAPRATCGADHPKAARIGLLSAFGHDRNL